MPVPLTRNRDIRSCTLRLVSFLANDPCSKGNLTLADVREVLIGNYLLRHGRLDDDLRLESPISLEGCIKGLMRSNDACPGAGSLENFQ